MFRSRDRMIGQSILRLRESSAAFAITRDHPAPPTTDFSCLCAVDLREPSCALGVTDCRSDHVGQRNRMVRSTIHKFMSGIARLRRAHLLAAYGRLETPGDTPRGSLGRWISSAKST